MDAGPRGSASNLMGQNGKFSTGIFGACIILIFVAIGLCAMEKTDLASAVGIAACALCAPGIYLAFSSWEETKEAPAIPQIELSEAADSPTDTKENFSTATTVMEATPAEKQPAAADGARSSEKKQ